ncbi:MAG: ATP-binding protein [Gammaproteobacteria bacterium]
MAEQRFARNIDRVPDVFRFAEDQMLAGNIDQSVRFPVHLAMEELFVNLVTYNPTATRDIKIEVSVVDNTVIVTITDHDAAEFDVTIDPKVDTEVPLSDRKPGGLGLHLIQSMADTLEYDYRDGRSRIRFSKEQAADDV